MIYALIAVGIVVTATTLFSWALACAAKETDAEEQQALRRRLEGQ